jgi:hypothetical protein
MDMSSVIADILRSRKNSVLFKCYHDRIPADDFAKEGNIVDFEN